MVDRGAKGQADLTHDLGPHVQCGVAVLPLNKWKSRPGVRLFHGKLLAFRNARRRELVGDGGELDDYFWRVRVDVDRALGDMAGSQVALNATAPGADKGEIQNSANHGAREGDEAAHPFFGGFL